METEAEKIEVTVKTMDSGQQKFEVNGEVHIMIQPAALM